MQSKADVHIHSKFSDRPSEWILRRVGAPESFVEPLDLYRRCRERGMDFVTISDHNCIRGALEIAHLPGTFISTEVTTYFPEDQAKIHCLVLGITERQFEMIQELRENIYHFRQYCLEEEIICSVAHVLFRVNDRLSVEHLEKLILLFDRFEVINGTRDPRAAGIVEAVLSNLTPEMIEAFAQRHELEPIGREPWKKVFTGGSDDHSGVYSASAYTETPLATTVEEYLDHLRSGDHAPGGTSGNSLRLAHSLYHIAYDFYKSRLIAGPKNKPDLLGEMFRRMLEEPKPKAPPTLGETLLGMAKPLLHSYQRSKMNATERLLVDECGQLFAQHRLEASNSAAPQADDDQRSFRLACRISAQLGYVFFRDLVKHVRSGNLIESLQTLCSLAPVALSVAPFLASFRTQHKDESFCQDVAARFPAARPLTYKSDKRCWVTDTFTDVNGVVRTIRTLSAEAQAKGRPLSVLTCLDETPDVTFPLQNFKPVGSFPLPEYDAQILACPPVLEIIEYLEREQFSELIISTPGPLGLTALAAGKLLGLRLSGIYHTDFPRYVGSLTDDVNMEQLTWQYMLWFYGQMDVVFAPSQAYRRELVEVGLDPERLKIMQRGVDLALFSPHWRDEHFWQRWKVAEGVKFLYVGRISKEKGLEQLLATFRSLDPSGQPSSLILVGDGPALVELSAKYQSERIVFTGPLFCDDLSHAYASADVFVFPSTTDTFGNAVLEAQAAGLPAIVANQGGPPEIIARHQSGWIIDMQRPEALVEALTRLRDDRALRAILSERALANARESTWDRVLDALWTAAQETPRKKASHESALSWATTDLGRLMELVAAPVPAE